VSTRIEHPLLSEILPAFAIELEELLRNAGEAELAKLVPSLKIVERCRCGDDFCATFYARPKPAGTWGAGHRSLSLDPREGMIILDVVDGSLACVEVLYRDDVRKKLLATFP
jgi:hypothetical protein